MSLVGSLNIGGSALAASQAALQVTGNNIANAGNADYTRQTASLTSLPDQQLKPGMFVGTGVDLSGISRQIDQALEGRLRASNSDVAAADGSSTWLGRVQSVFNELGDQDLSTQFSTFFNSWSGLANKPQDAGLRQVVLQDGASLAGAFQSLRGQLGGLQTDAASQLTGLAQTADGLAQQVATLNGQILTAEGGNPGGQANDLRDKRDAVLKQLSQLMGISTVEQANGVVNVYSGSEPLVLNAQSRGVTVKQSTDAAGNLTSSLAFKSNGGTINVTTGQLGSLIAAQAQIQQTITGVDRLASGLIFELNKIHASGQGLAGFSTVTAANAVADPTAALNDPKSGLKFTPTNGSFVVHVKQKGSGLETSTLVQVDLDGLGGNDTSLNSLRDSLNATGGVTASISGGKLTIQAASADTEVSFSQDSSGVLASLGVNNFFTGTNARTIAVSQTLLDQPSLLAAAKNGDSADNQTARAIASLESTTLASLNGASLKDNYQSMINGISTATAAAKTNSEAAHAVDDTLSAQRQSLSGVSVDEEAINLVKQQQAFQGAARYIAAINEMMKSVIQMV